MVGLKRFYINGPCQDAHEHIETPPKKARRCKPRPAAVPLYTAKCIYKRRVDGRISVHTHRVWFPFSASSAGSQSSALWLLGVFVLGCRHVHAHSHSQTDRETSLHLFIAALHWYHVIVGGVYKLMKSTKVNEGWKLQKLSFSCLGSSTAYQKGFFNSYSNVMPVLKLMCFNLLNRIFSLISILSITFSLCHEGTCYKRTKRPYLSKGFHTILVRWLKHY